MIGERAVCPRVSPNISNHPNEKVIAVKSFVLFVVPSMVVALSVLAVASVAAAEPVWLANGAETLRRAFGAQGGSQDFTFEEFMGTKIKVKISCIMFWRGFVAGNSVESNKKLDETTEVLSINLTLPLECHYVEEGPCAKSESPNFTAINLPWATELAMSGTKFRDKIRRVGGTANPGWKLSCLVLGVTVTESCTSASGEPELVNFTLNETVDLIYNKSLEPNYECTGSKNPTMSIEGNIEMKLNPGEVLSVS